MKLLKLVKNIGQCKDIPPSDSKYLFEGYMDGWGTIYAQPSFKTLFAYIYVQLGELFQSIKRGITKWD